MSTDSDQPNPSELSAQEWRHLRIALGTRLSTLKAEMADIAIESERQRLQKEIDSLEKQVEKLLVEESVAQFVEDSERYVIAQSALSAELEDDSGTETDFFRH